MISSLRFDNRKKIFWSVIPKWQDKGYDLTEIIFTIMRLMRNVEVLLLFKRMGKNTTRVNFRSRASVDVNRIAKFFGGGGHKKASGTTMDDDVAEAEKKVIAFIKRYTNGMKKTKR